MTPTIQDEISGHLLALERLYRIVDERKPTGERLTVQELQACTLAASGLTDRQIADRLYLAADTIGRHLSSAYRKLGVRKRTQLAAALAGRDVAA